MHKPKNSDRVKALTSAMNSMFQATSHNTRPRQRAPAEGSYPFIPYRCEEAINLLEKAAMLFGYRPYSRMYHGRPSFLDIGCGAGNICLLANAVGMHANGLDLDEVMLKHGRKFVTTHNAHLFKANALTYRKYGDYDILYSWRPMADPELWEALQRRLIEEAKLEALIILPWWCEHIWPKDRRVRCVYRSKGWGMGRIYEKVKE